MELTCSGGRGAGFPGASGGMHGISESDAAIVLMRQVSISSLATRLEWCSLSDKMRPHAASIRVCVCPVFNYVCGVQLWQWLWQDRNSCGGREEYLGVPRIDHNPNGKAATVLRHGDLLRWIDKIRADRHYMELFQYGCRHGG